MKRIIKPFLAGLLILSMFSCPAIASPFPDVADDEDYKDAVEFVQMYGIMIGDEKGNFNPDKPVTRAEMATIICRMIGKTTNLQSNDDFDDVPLSHWANAYVTKAVELGVVNGYGNRKFGPADTVTFEQALAMLVRVMGMTEDAEKAGGYPNGYIKIAQDQGYTNWLSAEKGDLLTRSQVAILIYNAIT